MQGNVKTVKQIVQQYAQFEKSDKKSVKIARPCIKIFPVINCMYGAAYLCTYIHVQYYGVDNDGNVPDTQKY